ncbi:BTAD domain-containing putative transcriptional regulator [Streptomyces coerulescens]|uniref:BTAD domain-containing putative transcriptional regulator n=1 Tax=Streptomyces coerulescens TaxID=29304 RepID=A0ABW0CMS1_STRCD
MSYRLLGPVSVFDDASELDAGPAKQRAVLAMLLCADGAFLARREIVRGVWGGSAPATASQVVATYVARLRKILEPARGYRADATVLLSRGDSYALPTDPGRFDIRAFEQAVHGARQLRADGDLTGCVKELERGLALWRGPALEGVPGPHAARERHRLGELRLAGQEGRLAVLLDQGGHTEAVPELSALAAAHPARERIRALLMLALHRTGRRAEALGVFQDTWRTLAAETGIEPGRELRDLQRRILDGDPELLVTHREPVTVHAVASQLPPGVPDFVGRRGELAALRRLAARATGTEAVPRIALITGPGGVGKSALAVHAAHRLADRYPDGRLHVRLDGTRARPARPEDVLGRLLEDLGVPHHRIPAGLDRRTDLFRTVTSGRRLLLVLDDARRGAQVRPLLPASADCLVLVTSRSKVTDLATRNVLRLSALDEHDARAMLRLAVGPERVENEPAAVDAVLQVCAGLPLALRVVAARVVDRPPGAFAVLARRLLDEERRMGELAAGDLAVASSFRVSYDSLPNTESATAFRLLSEPAVPDLGVADAAAALDLPEDQAEGHLETLADAHLLEVFLPAPGARYRYRYHDLLRVFGRSLGHGAARRDTVTAVLARLVPSQIAAVHAADRLLRPGHSTGKDYRGPRASYGEHRFRTADEALTWLKAERGTILGAALQAAATGAVAPAQLAELTTLLRAFLMRCGHWPDWEQLAEATVRLARAGPDPLAEAIGRLELGTVAAARRQLGRAQAELESSAELFASCGDTRRRARALNNLGLVQLDLGEFTAAADCLETALDVHRAAGQRLDTTIALDNLALLNLRRGALGRAQELCAESLAIHETDGTTELASATLNILGLVRHGQGRHAEAVECQRRSRELARAQGNLYREAFALLDAATAHRAAGRNREAIECAEQGLGIRRDLGDPHGTAAAFTVLADALKAAGDADRAEACRAEAAAVRTAAGI